jgi:hypothetical protein
MMIFDFEKPHLCIQSEFRHDQKYFVGKEFNLKSKNDDFATPQKHTNFLQMNSSSPIT